LEFGASVGFIHNKTCQLVRLWLNQVSD